MKLPIGVLRDLAILDRALDDGTELEQYFGQLVHELVDAVPSLLALWVSVTIDGYPLVVGVDTDDLASARASIAIALPTQTSGTSAQMIAYASDPMAFIGLRVDAIHGMGIHPDSVTLDSHPVDIGRGVNLATLSTINQAVGVLIDQGRTPEAARAYLHTAAAAADLEPVVFARGVVADAARHREGGRDDEPGAGTSPD